MSATSSAPAAPMCGGCARSAFHSPAMFRRPAVLSCLGCLVLLTAGSGIAQPAPPVAEPQPGRVFCEQTITYRVADPSTVPEPYRRFLGPWSDAAWDATTCAAWVATEVHPDGTASIIYVYGPLGPSTRVPS